MNGEDDAPMVHSWEDLPSIGKKFSEEEFQKKLNLAINKCKKIFEV